MKCQASRPIRLRRLCAVALTVTIPMLAGAQVAGESVNMVSGTQWPGGDPFLQRQNEPSIAVSSANPMHLLAGANDYRTVDVPVVPGATKMAADAWQGVFKSFDGGQTWKSYLMPGYPQDVSYDGSRSAVRGPGGAVLYNAGADPVVRAGTDGMFYFAGIVFARGTNDGRVVLNRFIDLNNKENGDPTGGKDSIQWVDAKVVDQGGTYFADKPWIAIDVPRAGALTCNLRKNDAQGNPLFQRSFLGGAIYMVWARIYSDTQADVMFSRSLDCGDTWSTPLKLNDGTSLASQGVVASVDPRSGDVYVAWRRFAVPTANPPQDDAIFAARTFSRGNKFTRPRLLTSITPFDQAQDPARRRFRTEALPTITSSVNAAGTQSWTHVAWAQRGTNGDSRIVVSLVPVKPPPPSNDEDDDPCDGWKIPAVPLDTTPITDDAGNAFSRGHQFMPQLTFSQGRIVAVYYDSRLDHSRKYYRPYDPCLPVGTCWGPDSQGRWYTEERGPLGERGLDLDWVRSEIDDTDLTQVRHAVEVRLAMAVPVSQPIFTSVALSRMPFGSRGDESPADADPNDPGRDQADPARRPFAFGAAGHIDLVDPSVDPDRLLRLQDLQSNPPNLPIFKNGTVPFIGDYIDVQGPMFVRTATGWAFDTQPTPSPVFHAVWTSNQDVMPPPDGNWTRYTPVGLRGGDVSLVDPGQTVPGCVPGYGGSRNQNIYTARISGGLFVTSPQNAKSLSPAFPRNFVVSAFNSTSTGRTFTFSFTPPAGVQASFEPGGGAPITNRTVIIPAHSSVAQTIFMSLAGGANPATMAVNVVEVGGALAGSVTLNPPGLTFDLTQPDGTGDSIAAGEVLTVRISAANLSNANLSNANLSSANLSNANLSNANLSNANLSNANLSNATTAVAHLSNANLSNANLSNANLSNANLSNANLSNANLSNANLSNANLSNAAVTDIDYTVTNTGNTTQAFDVRLLATAATRPVQLIVSRTYTKPIASGCELLEQPDNQLVVNAGIVDPADPASVGAQDPLATFSLAPGDTIQVTLRSFSSLAEARTLATTMAPVVTPQGAPGSGSVALLVKNDATLPAAQVNTPYTLPLEALGGTGSLTWGLAAGSALPDGLRIVGSQISGTPSIAGSFAVTLELTDEATPLNLTQKDVTLLVQKGATTTGLSTSTSTAYHGDPVTLTATVAPGAGPTGDVTFRDGATVIGTAAASASGAATLVTSALPVGPHDITASYGGDGNWLGSSSSATTVRIKVRTVLTLTTDPPAPVYGGLVALVATIDPLPAGAPAPTAGAQFHVDGAFIGSGSFSGGVAVSPTFSPGGGAHVFGVTFAGDANYDGASVIGQPATVLAAPTAVDLASSASPADFGVSVTFQAQVTSPVGTPDGHVTFYDGTANLDSAPVDSSGNATLIVPLLSGGSHDIRAWYEGTADFAPSGSLTVKQVVTAAGTVATLSSSLNPARLGQGVTFTCTVSSSAGSPTGAVTFRDGAATVATVATSTGSSGTGAPTWSWTTSTLSAGSHSLTCSYASDGNFAASASAALVQTVTSPVSTTLLTVSPNPVREDKLATYQATVSGAGGTPTGTVTFLDGATVIGTATLSLGKGTLTRKPGREGLHSITAVYGGSATVAGSTSAVVALRVLEEYSCSAYKSPLVTGGTVKAPSRSGNFTIGTKVAVKWQFRKATGAYVSRPTAVTSLEAVYDAACNGRPAASAARIALFAPATGATAGSTFAYDTAANQYSLIWNTSKASKGCWDIVLTPDNGVPQVATIVTLK